MADLRLDGSSLSALQNDLSTIKDRLDGVRGAMGHVSGHSMGVDEIASAMGSFGHKWGYGVGQLGEQAHSAAGMVGQILDAFDRVEQELKASIAAATKGKS